MATPDPKLETHWRLLMPTNYLCPADLRGQEMTLTISKVEMGDLPLEGTAKKERKILIYFEGASKPWAPSKTALREIDMTLRTGVTADWVGKDITLLATRKERTGRRKGKPIRDPGTGKNAEGIRVRVRRTADDDVTDDSESDNPADEPKE